MYKLKLCLEDESEPQRPVKSPTQDKPSTPENQDKSGMLNFIRQNKTGLDEELEKTLEECNKRLAKEKLAVKDSETANAPTPPNNPARSSPKGKYYTFICINLYM